MYQEMAAMEREREKETPAAEGGHVSVFTRQEVEKSPAMEELGEPSFCAREARQSGTLGLILLGDGVLTAIFGKRFVRVTQALLPGILSWVPALFLLLPSRLLRAGAAAEAIYGLMLYQQSRRGETRDSFLGKDI